MCEPLVNKCQWWPSDCQNLSRFDALSFMRGSTWLPGFAILNVLVTTSSCCIFGALSNLTHGPPPPHSADAGVFLLELEVRSSQRNCPLDNLPRGDGPNAPCGRPRDCPGRDGLCHAHCRHLCRPSAAR